VVTSGSAAALNGKGKCSLCWVGWGAYRCLVQDVRHLSSGALHDAGVGEMLCEIELDGTVGHEEGGHGADVEAVLGVSEAVEGLEDGGFGLEVGHGAAFGVPMVEGVRGLGVDRLTSMFRSEEAALLCYICATNGYHSPVIRHVLIGHGRFGLMLCSSMI
jgi:hypothetical protein